MHVALPGTSSDDVLISPDIISVPVPPSAVLNNVFGTEVLTHRNYSTLPLTGSKSSCTLLRQFMTCVFFKREGGDVVS